jgi:hypothetical protein
MTYPFNGNFGRDAGKGVFVGVTVEIGKSGIVERGMPTSGSGVKVGNAVGNSRRGVVVIVGGVCVLSAGGAVPQAVKRARSIIKK